MGIKLTRAIVIERANSVHKNKYEYPDFKYRNISQKVTVICPNHGGFRIALRSHVYNEVGCPVCMRERMSIETSIRMNAKSKK